MDLVTLVVNGERQEVVPGTSVANLISDIGCGTAGVAVAVNAEVVPRSCWETTRLREQDQVEVLIAMQGG